MTARLIGDGTDAWTLHVWDLRAVRQGPVELGLQGEIPAFPPATEKASPPVRVEVLQ
jgi:hypothetical protein